jgi:hypothetical protein
MTARHAGEAVAAGTLLGILLGVIAYVVLGTLGDGPEFPY